MQVPAQLSSEHQTQQLLELSYLFDVALDELGGGHLLGGQALLQL